MLDIRRTIAEVIAVGPVARKMGNSGEYDHGMFVTFAIESTSAEHLDEMEKGLRKSMYKKASKQRKAKEEEAQADMLPEQPTDLIEPRYAGRIKSFPWDDEMEGYAVALGSGLTATKPRVFQGAVLKNFKVAIKDGGTISLTVTAIVDCDREHKGWLCEQLRHKLELSLVPPTENLDFLFGEEENIDVVDAEFQPDADEEQPAEMSEAEWPEPGEEAEDENLEPI